MQPFTRSCSRCGKEFVIEHARHKRQVFCSVTCSANARPVSDPSVRFRAKVAVGAPGDCWLWLGAHGAEGYGSFYFQKRVHPAHRAAWIIANGPIPDGLLVMHRCDNPRCVNPSHLQLGTYTDNSIDMVTKGRHRGKLRPEDVLAIRADGRLHRVIASEYGVSRTMVSNIKRGDSCSWVAA